MKRSSELHNLVTLIQNINIHSLNKTIRIIKGQLPLGYKAASVNRLSNRMVSAIKEVKRAL